MRAVNLIPSDDRGGSGITAGRSGGGVMVIAGLLAGLAVLALLYGLADHQISGDRSEVASLTVRAQQAQARAGELAPYTSFLQMREQRVKAVTTLVDSRFDWAQAFQELGRVLPAGKVSLGSIEGTVGSTAASTPASSSSSAASASSVTSATPPGSIPVFKLTGCAVSQAEVALMLERLRLIDGVDEVSLQSSTQSAESSSGASSGGGCAGGNPSFTAQITFDALPAIPTSGTATGTGASTAASTSAATSSGATETSASPSTTTTSAPSTTTTTPAASAASASSPGAVR